MDGVINEHLTHWANDLLVWIGFGTLVGVVAKAIMPGHDRGGALATLLMGIAGTAIGCGTLMLFSNGLRVTPISPMGFVVALAGSSLLLFLYRLQSGRLLREDAGNFRKPSKWWATRRRGSKVTVIEK